MVCCFLFSSGDGLLDDLKNIKTNLIIRGKQQQQQREVFPKGQKLFLKEAISIVWKVLQLEVQERFKIKEGNNTETKENTITFIYN